MKIIYDGCYGKNIQFTCKRCGCVYEIESRDDWTINFVHPNRTRNLRLLVPEYNVICPKCKYEEHLSFDPDDLVGTEAEKTFCGMVSLLNKREDWKKRFKIEVKYEQNSD